MSRKTETVKCQNAPCDMIVTLLFSLIFIFKISFKFVKQCVDFGQRSDFKMTPSKSFGFLASESVSLTVSARDAILSSML